MEAIKSLLDLQLETGETIQSIVRNFKKDPADRKTKVSYFEERSRRLQESWNQFQDTDSKIREVCDDPMKFEYFSEGYYDKIRNLASDYIELFKTEAARLKQNTEEPKIAKNPKQDYLPTKESTSVGVIRRLKARITALNRLLRGLTDTDNQPLQYFDLNINTIKRLWDQIEELYDEALDQLTDPSAYGLDQMEYDDVHDLMQQTLVNLSVRADKLRQSSTKQTTSAEPVLNASGPLNLPKLTIPKFDGDYLKWRQFYDLFSEMVDKQPIPAIQKMWYLKNNLSGEAEHLISQFPLSEINYITAWKTLQERYNNKRILVANLVDKILNLPSISSSAQSIKEFHDTTKECLLALNNLGIATSSWDALLIQLMIKKLDRNTHIRYMQSLTNPRDIPSVTDLLSFLERQFQSMEAISTKEKTAHKAVSALITSNNNGKCALCHHSDHKLYHCSKFLQLSEIERLRWVQQHNLCVNCFGSDHGSKSCNHGSCRKCAKKHNTLLHLQKRDKFQKDKGPLGTQQKQPMANATVSPNTTSAGRPWFSTQNSSKVVAATSTKANDAARSKGYVLLATAKVIITALNGASDEFRAVLDSGSQVNIVSKRLCQKLSISPLASSLCLDGIGEIQRKSQYRVNINMKSIYHNFSANVDAYVLPSIIPAQPSQYIDPSTWDIPKNIQLADPHFYQQEKVDLLLGAEFYYKLVQHGTIHLADELPTLQNTVLGWIVGGAIRKNPFSKPTSSLTCGVYDDTSLEEAIENLWKLDEIEVSRKNLSPSEKQCEFHFTQHTLTNEDGRFIVSLPFRENPTALGESQPMAYNRFLGLEHRLLHKEDMRTQYIQFMQEYEQLGHMERIDINTISDPKYFIPHHCVLKPDSTTTKFRVVFDASAKTSSGHSLNDLMYTGPTLQSELFSILLRFRLPKFVFTTDIEKMYRQILIHPDDQKYQLIIWREDPSLPINYYKLNTVTYGTRAAPYLATKCLQKIADENLITYPYGSQMLKHNFYVDDGLGGDNNLNIALEIQKELIFILKRHGFNLKKWCANHPSLLKNIPLGDQEVDLDFNSNSTNTIKALGLLWVPKTDQLCVKVKINPPTTVSKRSATSDLARLFDPLGLLAPVVVRAKIFIQQLWQFKLDWDEPLPEDLHEPWTRFRNELDSLNNLKIPRHMFKGEIPAKTQLHIFADASEKAYGAVAYIRATLKDGRIIVQLLCSKTRVAPLKKQTLPRLELCAAVTAAQLVHRVQTDLQIKNQAVYLWTDSEIVLSWINNQSSLYHTFVANRVSKIQSLTLPEQWRHVRSKDNPADLLSRGLPATKLSKCTIWFYGPLFLHGREEIWPPTFLQRLIPNDIEKKKTTVTLAATTSNDDFIYNIPHKNSFRTLQRIVGYILRFIRNTRIRKEDRPKCKALIPLELDNALHLIIKTIQRSDFSSEISQFRENKEVDKKSSIISLSPYLDDANILRVGGRLEASLLSYDAKHPMLIPYNDPLAKLLFTMIHEENHHCGSQALLNIIRQKFWPIKGKIMARSIVQKCIRCIKARPQLCQQIMGNLPHTRVTPARPFINTGVDYCGPFWIHYRIRGKRPTKSYIAVFCCFSTKAVHLELVSDLSTEAFIGALKRFIGRRGRCQNIYCDNATNFVGAKNQLIELSDSIYSSKAQESIISASSSKGIQFNFIPPRAPHFGGLWEAAVKSAKHLLVRSVANASLTQEELETIIVEIEAILNSRPITPMTNDPNDLEALTPGHFLIGEALTSQVDSKAKVQNMTTLSHWKLISHLKQAFWNRWCTEYLNELQQRSKWQKQFNNLKTGDMVIIKEDNTPVMKWPLGRIIKVYTGDDGAARVAEIKTASGIFKRPIHRLALLPTNPDPEITMSTEVNNKNICNSPDEPKAKRIKIPTNHITMTLLTLLLILPISLATPVTNQKFGSKIGIHFEQFGTVAISTTQWNLLVYYDLSSYWSETSILANGTRSIQALCKMLQLNASCAGTIEHFKQMENELQLDNRLLRSKRGALDIVGNMAHSLFGVLDSEYAEHMSATIKEVNENESYLLQLLRNQTSIIDSTMNIIQQNQIDAKTRFERLEQEITMSSEKLNNINNLLVQLHLNQLFNSAVLQLSLIANNLKDIQSAIIETLMDTRHGKISPWLLTMEQLQREVTQISLHSPPSLNLPVSEQNGLLSLFKLMRIQGRLTQQYAIFKITLPLVEPERFSMVHLIAVPNTINSTLVAIKPCTTFLGISMARKQYIPFTSSEFSACGTIKPTQFVCSNIQIRYDYGSNVCACEIGLFNNQTTPSCSVEKTGIRWIPLHKENQWIYATSSSTRATAVCNGEIIPISLKGSGLLTLDPECSFKHNFATMNGRQFISSTIRSSYTSLGQISDLLLPNNTSFSTHNNSSTPTHLEDTYTKNMKELSNLQKSLREENIMDLPNKLKSHQLHNNMIAYLALCVSILTIICWFQRKICNRRHSVKTADNVSELQSTEDTTPTPMPRQSTPTRQFVLTI